MAGVLEEDDDVIASINMVPFIDISLVLLIIFMVTSSYIIRQGIEVELPSAASGGELAPSTIAIVVFADGSLQFNGDDAQMGGLEALIEAELANDPATQAVIAADRSVDYGVVMDVVDSVKLAGVATFALNIERESPP